MHPAAASATRRREQAQNPRTRSDPRFGALETPNHSPAQCNALTASTDCSALASNKRDDNPSSVTLIDDWINSRDTNSTQQIAFMMYTSRFLSSGASCL
ncbi:hypothetical protein FVEG_15085 [Fusarium verticillioides 7600]|uniref:Uncharacterized protein n=1 Tax=Gibberella moniliformis (strain M3125 / FGSC 7600) TaxID=334819 RepID=W7LKE4_GIBM7|nr:hypothetical protein FVEG_15085 [Fusarium verticillioides 7600]EWG39878.1 hypothetical protein FVEG_15085 [Fusarium verticillioides 7600]